MPIRDAIACLRDETGSSREECKMILKQEGKIRSGGNVTNGLLANGKGGASLLINTRLATEHGIHINELRTEVSQCSRVKHPDKKIAEHLRNCQEYARPHRLAACDLKNVLASLELLSPDGKTVPTVCVNGIPAPSITHSTVLSWSDDTILTSPLLAAIAAYETGKRPPHWVQSYMRRSV
jgi:hypothetical protein